MESKRAIAALSALAQDSRLHAYRLLVEAGPSGLQASVLAERLGTPANTLSFHLKALRDARLVRSVRRGRCIDYYADLATIDALLDFLTRNCCGGRDCGVGARRRRAA